MNKRDLEKAMEGEVARWPGASVEFVDGGKHPKAKLRFGELTVSVPYPGSPGDAFNGVHNQLSQVRRALKKMDAVRDKPEPSKDEDEAPYRKPNEGREKRPDPVKGEKVEPKPDVADQLVKVGAATPEQATAARDAVQATASAATYVTRAEVEDAVEKLAAEFKERVEGIVDGIYFDLPEDVYHAVPRLSSSGIQKLCVSPATFWRGSWMDPDREEERDEDEKLFRKLGRAYHMARLQPELFDACFVRELDKADYPKARLLVTGSDMKAELEEMGLKVSGTVAEQAERLADNGCQKFIWKIEEENWEKERKGRTAIPAKHFDQMKTDIERIHHSSDIADLLSGGCAEVSIFWTDQYGIKMKARTDYLAVQHFLDFKTFDNSRGKELEQCLVDAVRYNRYYVQAVVYREAVEALRQLTIIGDATDAQRDLIAKIQINPGEMECWYAFQEKGGVPNLVAWEFPFYTVPYSTLFHDALVKSDEQRQKIRDDTQHKSRICERGERDVFIAKRNFALYSQVYSDGTPWFPLKSKGRFSDDMFNTYWLEGGLQ